MMFKQVVDPFYSFLASSCARRRTTIAASLYTTHHIPIFHSRSHSSHRISTLTHSTILQVYLPGSFKKEISGDLHFFVSYFNTNICMVREDFRKFFYLFFFER